MRARRSIPAAAAVTLLLGLSTTLAGAPAPAAAPARGGVASDAVGAADPELVPAAVRGDASVPTAAAPPPKRFGRTAVQVVGVNLLVWTYDRFIREGGENPVFRVGFRSWEENLRAGWEWDDNNFNTNQFLHPYHGNLYFNAARSNGYPFWEATGFTFAGSWLWEYLFETHHPSLNDWVATSVSGAALGEIFHRLGGMVRDQTATGAERTWRELGGFVIDPIGGLNRLLDGSWSRQGANPPGRFPASVAVRLDAGLRTRSEDRLWAADTTRAYLEVAVDHGSPFTGDHDHPYDHFDFTLQLNFGDASTIGRVEGNGYLAGAMLKDSDRVRHFLGAYHRYDFVNTRALEFGGQSVTAGLDSRFQSGDLELRTGVHLGPLILGGSSSDHESVSGRSYDFGPGFSARVSADLRGPRGWSYLQVSHEQFWLHAVSGNAATHHLLISRVRAAAPLREGFGLGAEYVLFNAERRYTDYPDVSARAPQTRLFGTWSY